MKTFKTFAVPALTLFLICLVLTTLLAFTNEITEPRILQLAKITEQESRKEVLPEAQSFGEEKTIEKNGTAYSYVEGLDENGETVGLIFITITKGYNGDIKVMTGVDMRGRVSGVAVLEIDETPGLGNNAAKESFRSQYNGKSSGIKVGSKNTETEISAITGATITSAAFTAAVNEALSLFDEIM